MFYVILWPGTGTQYKQRGKIRIRQKTISYLLLTAKGFVLGDSGTSITQKKTQNNTKQYKTQNYKCNKAHVLRTLETQNEYLHLTKNLK